MGSPATLLMMRTAIAPAALAFATFWLKVHVASVNDRQLAGGAGIDAGATVRLSVEEIKRVFRQRIEVTHCGADCCSADGWIRKRLADEMLVRAPSDRDDVARAARGLKRALTGTAVTSSNGHYESCIDSVVESIASRSLLP